MEEQILDRDIALFYYYSSPPLPEGCFLGMSNEIAYRNMFMLPCPDSRIHFEFPVFEDHSYNTICNRVGLRALITKPTEHDKYIVFRTRNHRVGGQDIVGFYRIRRAYYQETNMFNNNGFVWGIEADPHLVRSNSLKYQGPPIPQGPRVSWNTNFWSELLNDLLDKIADEENLSDLYQSEASRIVELLKSGETMARWERYCGSCPSQSCCAIYTHYSNYVRTHPDSSMFAALRHSYSSNLYSKNVLNQLPRVYLK